MTLNTLWQTGWQAARQAVLPPTVAEFWLNQLHPRWSWSQPLASVVARQPLGPNLVTLVLRPNRHVASFAPGQHVSISVSVDGVRCTRSYSPSAVPDRPGCFAITVKRMPGGRVSEWLCQHADVGTVLAVGAAYGEMTLPTGAWTALAAGSGITPFISLLRSADLSGAAPVRLHWWVRTRDDAGFAAELAALAQRWPAFRWQLHVTAEGDARLGADLAQALDGQVLACGPQGFVAQARALAARRDLPFLGESFFAPLPVQTAGAPVQVHLARSGRTLTLASGVALLPALEAEGLQPAYGCRRGICNTCVCDKTAGRSRDLLSGQLDSQAGALRLCISSAESDLTLDL